VQQGSITVWADEKLAFGFTADETGFKLHGIMKF
jgi:hypothetical protein